MQKTSGILFSQNINQPYSQGRIRPGQKTSDALTNMGILAKLLDTQFKIPGTNIRFGMDALMGIIPGVGDLSTFAISGYMLTILAKNGASGYVLARMVLNILIDSLIGAIPIAGDVFDVFFKANMRNMRLMHEHYVEGRYKGGAWKVVVPVFLLVALMITGFVWVSYQLLSLLF